jgi:hypothetical protein
MYITEQNETYTQGRVIHSALSASHSQCGSVCRFDGGTNFVCGLGSLHSFCLAWITVM